MPGYNAAKIRTVGTTYLPEISAAIRTAQKALQDTSGDWSRPFNDLDAEEWQAVCVTFTHLLGEAATRVDEAATAIITVADNYGQAEAQAEASLTEILNKFAELQISGG